MTLTRSGKLTVHVPLLCRQRVVAKGQCVVGQIVNPGSAYTTLAGVQQVPSVTELPFCICESEIRAGTRVGGKRAVDRGTYAWP